MGSDGAASALRRLLSLRAPRVDEAHRDALNAEILCAVNATGEVFLSHTKIDGRYAIRLAIGNLRTQRSDVEHAWSLLKCEALETKPS